MQLERMGCFHQTRLSFMRGLLRKLSRDQWRFRRSRFDVDENGEGVVVYEAKGPERTYSLICYAHDLPDELRSDRVIAERWDATFALFDGVPDDADIERLGREVPLQEAGRCSEAELVLSRANRSVRLFDHVVERLARGLQPDLEMIESVGYLMRTTAVYGNGKFGLSDRERIADREEFSSAFRSELLAVWLIRWFTIDIVEHMARVVGGASAAPLDPAIARRLGVGNSTGLGMAPFLVTHPALLHTWINARETALARVRAIPRATAATRARFREILAEGVSGVAGWVTADPRQAERVVRLTDDLQRIQSFVDGDALNAGFPWNTLIEWSESALSIEGQEYMVSLVIEPHGEVVDDLADQMAVDESPWYPIDGGVTVGETLKMIEDHYGWTLDTDFSDQGATARFWYVSEEKLEPRLGERYQEPGAELEQPLAFARDIQRLYRTLQEISEDTGRQQAPEDKSGGDRLSMARFLLRNPAYRGAVRRVQIASRLRYAEIRSNLIAADMVPVDLLRCKLSFFGASRFDPRSDRWTRITMYKGAPLPFELEHQAPDDWSFGGDRAAHIAAARA